MPYSRQALFTVLSIFVSPALFGQSLTNFQVVSQSGSNVTYRSDLLNPGPALTGATATLSSTDPFVYRVIAGQDTLNFGPVPANGQVTSTNTFTLQESNPNAPLDTTKLQVSIQTTGGGGPVANAGFNQTTTVGSTITLNGSGSTNPSGVGTLTYSWAFTSIPAGSSAFLSHSGSVMPTFVVDVQGNYVIALTVSNGSGSSTASVTVSTFHTAPVANAGPNQTVATGATVVLNGGASSSPDGRPLTYSWTLLTTPSGSAAALTGATTVSPTFVADKPGPYVARLIVNDGLTSNPSNVIVSAQSAVKPVANAGPNQFVGINSVVQLNGSGSTDANGLPLTYQWSLISLPAGSAAVLSNPAAVNPTFTADRQGTYVGQLIVNNGSLSSDPATVTISTQQPLAPTANAGPNQTVGAPGATVTLHGSGTDPQNLPLTYQWTLLSKPAGSAATLSNATSPTPTFTADAAGAYVAQLVVNNGSLSSAPSTVTISTACAQPTANAGNNQNVATGATATLNGSGSGDACNDPLTYQWTLLSKPAGSAAALSGAATVSPTFVADVAGTYVAQLIVNNGVTPSNPATVTITAAAANGPSILFNPSSLNLSVGGGSLTVIVPQGTDGLVVNLSSSNTNVATVASSVTIFNGAANVVVTPGNASGTAIITATATGYGPGTATVNVALPTITVTLDSTTVGLTSTINGSIILSAQAPSGATVTVAASPSGIVTLQPVNVTIAPGGNGGAFTLTGATLGMATVTASSPGYNTGSVNVIVGGLGAINLPPAVTVGPGQSVPFPVTLVTGAPAGGVTVTLSSSDPSKAVVAPSTVFIPARATAPSAQPQLSGINPGAAVITATAPGFVSGTSAVNVGAPPITVTLDTSTVGLGSSINGTVTLGSPAPSGGTLVVLSANPSGIVTLPSGLNIAAGATTGTFPVTGGALGTTTITASSPGYTTGAATITVGGLGAIILPSNVTVGPSQSAPFPVNLVVGAPTGGVTVTLISSDPSKVTITPGSVFIPARATAPATQPQVNGINFGSATITASAPGFTGDSKTVLVGGALSFSPASLTIAGNSSQNLALNLSAPAPAGGLTVTLSSNNTGSATVPSTVNFAANATSVAVPVTGLANGSATITASAAGVTNATASVSVVTFGQIGLPANVSVLPGQSAAFPVTLPQFAPAGGVTVTLTSGDSSKVTVSPGSVFIPQGATTPAAQPTVTGVAIGSASITASAPGFITGVQTVKVPATATFTPASLSLNANTTQNLTLTLSSPAPAGGLTVNLSSDNAAVATVPSTATFIAGATTLAVPVTGVGTGSAIIHASALPAVADTAASITVLSLGSINLPSGVTLIQGQSASFTVVLSAAAPAGGVTVTLASSNPSKVTVSPATVFIAAGATTPATQPQVAGVSPGSANITASAPGWNSASQTVQVTNLTIAFSPSSLTINGTATQNIALNLSAPAPAGGLIVNLSSNNTAVASVPSTVNFAANATSVNVPVTGAGPGSATITASAPNIANATANVTVISDILLPAIPTIQPGDTVPFPVTLTKAAPAGGVFISLTSSDPSKVTVSPANVFIPQGSFVSNQPKINGIANGSAVITASASGLAPASQLVQVGSGGFTLSFSPPSLTIAGTGTQNLTLTLSAPASAGGLTVNLSSNNTSAATVPPSVTFGANATSATVPVTGAAPGFATITASAPGIPNVIAGVTVTAAGAILLPSSTTITIGQSAVFQVTLSVAASAGGVTVNLTSGDTSKATVTQSVFISAGATSPASQPQVNGVGPGSTAISATATGYLSGSGQIQVLAAAGGSSSFVPATLTLGAGSTQNLTLNLSAPAPAGGATVTLSSTNTGVATVPATVAFAANATQVAVPVTGVAAGTATISASTPNFGTAAAGVTVSAPQPGIILPANVNVQLGQTAPFPVTLAVPAPSGGVFINLISSDPSKVTISPANIFIAQGGTGSNQPNVTGVAVGSVTITASASGFPSATAQVIASSTSALILSPGSLTIIGAGTQNLTLSLPSPAPVGGLTVNLNSTNPAVASVPATVTVPSNGSSVTVPVTAGSPGSATITASAAGFAPATAGITVAGAAAIILPANINLAPGDTVNFPITLGTPAPAGGAFINLTSSDPSKVTISPGAIFIAQGQTAGNSTPKVTGVAFGSSIITAQASGIGSASQTVSVSSALSFQPANLVITGTATTKSLTLALSSPAPAGGVTINVSSSAPSVATVPSTVFLPANSTNVNVPVTSVAPGTATVQASSLPGIPATAATVTVVTSPTVILPVFQAVGIGNTVPLPIGLSTPAPPSGVTVTLTSSDPSKYTVAPPTVFIAPGATVPATQPTITAGGFISNEGFSILTASAPGYTTATLDIHVGDAITIALPFNLTVGAGQTMPLPVALPGPAPAGGVTVTITSTNNQVATVTSTAFIPAGANQPTTLPVVTGVQPGFVTIEAAAAAYTSAAQTLQVK